MLSVSSAFFLQRGAEFPEGTGNEQNLGTRAHHKIHNEPLNNPMKTKTPTINFSPRFSVRLASALLVLLALAFAFCASALADPSKNVVVRTTQQPITKSVRRMCLVVEAGSRIPQPCERLAAIPTTANAMAIYGHTPTKQ